MMRPVADPDGERVATAPVACDPAVDPSIIDRQPRELRGSDIWSEVGYACTLVARYFRHEPLIASALSAAMVGAAIAVGLLTVQGVILLGRVIDALIARDGPAVWSALGLTVLIGLAGVLANTVTWASGYAIQIRWRATIAVPLVDRWMADRRYHTLAWRGEIDNPEQRIQEDAALIVERGLNIITFFFGIMSQTVPFVALLWGLSGVVSLRSIGLPLDLYGSMVWAALFWGIGWSWIIHHIGRPYQRYEITRQHLEADFRHALGRVRQSSEAIAFERGDENERQRVQDRFALIRRNWFWFGFYGTRTLATTSFEQSLGARLPYLLAVPMILAGTMSVGQMTIVASAFASVMAGTTWFVSYYKSLAEWLASTQRVRLLERMMERPLPPGATQAAGAAGAIETRGLAIAYPDGRPMLAIDDLTVAPGERLLLQGRSGSGKSTFFRAVADIWPFATGTVALPDERTVMYLPQRCYMPEGPLRIALTYPQPAHHFDDAAIRAAMTRVGLDAFVDRLDELSDWSRQLSSGEQQRVAAVRALLVRPDVLFLDEATSALDAGLEAQLYRALVDGLPGATIVSIAHRSSVAEFHTGGLEVADGVLRRKAA